MNARLVVFLMRGVSLRLYDEIGMLGREMALYQRLVEKGVDVAIVTHGGRGERAYAKRFPGITVRCNNWGLSPEKYDRWCPWLHAPQLWKADLVKADQMEGAEVALWSARRWGKTFLARCGYLHADVVAAQMGHDSPQASWARTLSRRVFAGADHVVVTTTRMRESVCRDYEILPEKISVIPNYVDVDAFSPGNGESPHGNRICTIGRLHPEKNYAMLLRAVAGLDVELLMVGSGPQEEDLRRLACDLSVNVLFAGNVAHGELPALLRGSALFVLPSHYEGHPKVVIEAMACGVPVIGTDVAGIRETVRHGKTGWLCEKTPQGLRSAIERVLSDEGLRQTLSLGGRRFVERHYALDMIVEQELALFARQLSVT